MTAGFDGVARVYRFLEYAAFGRTLQRARVAFTDRLTGCQSVLILGEGDGRFLADLARRLPASRMHCVDASEAMLTLAARRLSVADRTRITFERADARALDLGARTYDAVVTLFFLDCFSTEQVEALVARVSARLRPGAPWLFADFAIPPRGPARWHARVIVGGLYTFFRWRTGIVARELPASERALQRAGLTLAGEREFRLGLVRSAVYAVPAHS